jgi:nitroimidazol reductase NimA-like FMN-containing flavoprotein (pyridoxamine 5'-phosphate oxidase superfamily)
MRRKDREVTDPQRIEEILATGKVVHLGLVDEGRPYVVPLHYGYEWGADGALVLWCHGARQGRKVDVIRANPGAVVQIDCDVEDISGGDVACDYGSAYACVMGDARAQVVDDPALKAHGLRVLMRTQTGRDFEIPAARLAAVGVIRIEVPQISCKARQKPAVG